MKMLKKTICFAALALVALGCKKLPEGKGDLTLRFRAVFDQDPVVLYTSRHQMPDQDTFQLQLLQFFVAEVALINEENDTVWFGEQTNWVDCTKNHVTEQGALQGESFTLSNVPAGKYKQILFAIGVAPTINAKEPGDFTTASPLGDMSNYCSIRESYIFSKIEGRLNTTSGNIRSFMYHSGGAAMYHSVALSKDWTVKDNEEATLILLVDLFQVFYPEVGTPIDIETRFATGPDENGTQLAKDIVRNISKAIRVN